MYLMQLVLPSMVGVVLHVLVLDLSIKVLPVHHDGSKERYEHQVSESKK